MRRNLGKAITFALALAACGPSLRPPGDNPDGGDGGGGGGDGGNNDNPNSQGCSDDAKLIYTIDDDGTFSQFDPQTRTFKDLGTLSCPSSSSPFSMAISRDELAWVLYSNGDLFRVQIKNGLECTKSPWVRGTQGETKFGMGFSTDQAGGTTDTLYISGGVSPDFSTTSTLAKLDTGTMQATKVGTVTGWPELTGTGNAELWGFFPQDEAHIAKLDKSNGALLQNYRTTALDAPTGDPVAWAFAFHGGSFWVFLQKTDNIGDNTFVYQYNSSTGAYVGKTDADGRKIVGAGVSTCAPVIIL